MGSCQVRQPAQFYRIISKKEEDEFWINRIQLNYFRKRVSQLQKQMWLEIKSMEKQEMEKVTQKRNEVKQLFKQEMEQFKKLNPKKVRELRQEQRTVEDYLGWSKTQQMIEQLQLQTQHRIHTIKDELKSKFRKYFRFIETELLSKYKHVILNRYLDQQTVQEIFQSWKRKNEDKIKKVINDLEEQIKKRVTNQEHYKMRWNTVVDEDLFVKVAQSKPLDPRNIVDEGAQKNITWCGFSIF